MVILHLHHQQPLQIEGIPRSSWALSTLVWGGRTIRVFFGRTWVVERSWLRRISSIEWIHLTSETSARTSTSEVLPRKTSEHDERYTGLGIQFREWAGISHHQRVVFDKFLMALRTLSPAVSSPRRFMWEDWAWWTSLWDQELGMTSESVNFEYEVVITHQVSARPQ